ncbi:MAG: hypothetical protein NZM11_13655 [Anaerolineales bacterium]|nr:hypothetical protein [Anaerolineales bacterium]
MPGADCLITPVMPGRSYFSFGDRAKRMTLSMRAAKIPEIRVALCASGAA